MIYQAIDHLNFAQGEMAMFSTFIAWQLMQWGIPYWVAFAGTIAISFAAGVRHRARGAAADPRRAGAEPRRRRSSRCSRSSTAAPASSGTGPSRTFASPFGSGQFLGQNLINKHDAGMIGVTLLMLVLLYLFFRHTRIGLAMRAAAANPESARLAGIRVGWMTALGWGMAAAIGSVAGMLIAPVVFLEPNMMLEHPALRLRRRGGRRADQPGRRGARRLLGRRDREPRRHLRSGGRARDEALDRARASSSRCCA